MMHSGTEERLTASFIKSQVLTSQAKLSNIKQWATDNNLHLNPDKTLEIIFYARGRCSTQIVPPLTFQNIQCVNSIKALRITTVSPVNFQ